jgi:hypothetical protein
MSQYNYTIRTDAYTADYVAVDANDAVRQHAAAEGCAWETAHEFLAEFDEVDGAWAWIEANDSPEPRISSEHAYDQMP